MASVTGVPGSTERSVRGESRIKVQKIGLDLLRDRRDRGLHIDLQQIRHREDFRHIRNLKSCFGVRVQHDLRVAEVWILRLHRSTLGDVVSYKLRRNRHIDRIAGLGQSWFIIAIDKVPHHEVPYQCRQSICRHQFDDRVCYVF